MFIGLVVSIGGFHASHVMVNTYHYISQHLPLEVFTLMSFLLHWTIFRLNLLILHMSLLVVSYFLNPVEQKQHKKHEKDHWRLLTFVGSLNETLKLFHHDCEKL